MITINITITSLGVQRRDAFIPQSGAKGHQWGPVCLYVCLSIYLFICLVVRVAFLDTKACGLYLRAVYEVAGHRVSAA